jgi:signal transduction histidine kinase
MMKPLLLKKNQNIQVAITDVPVIKGNFNRLLQVFLNLISNSMDAMVEGGNIHISTGVDDDSVLVTVSDDGPGIPEELREKIFSPFFTTKQNGTGLGLSIVEEIIREHGGKIKLQDSKKGATFIIQLPCMEGAYADQKSAYS